MTPKQEAIKMLRQLSWDLDLAAQFLRGERSLFDLYTLDDVKRKIKKCKEEMNEIQKKVERL